MYSRLQDAQMKSLSVATAISRLDGRIHASAHAKILCFETCGVIAKRPRSPIA